MLAIADGACLVGEASEVSGMGCLVGDGTASRDGSAVSSIVRVGLDAGGVAAAVAGCLGGWPAAFGTA